MAKKKSSAAEAEAAAPDTEMDAEGDEEVVLQGTLVCAITGEHRAATPQEEVLQSFIEQLHREYRIDLADMARDVRVECASGEEGGKQRRRNRAVSLAVFEHGKAHDTENIIRAVIVAKPGTKPDEKAIGQLDEILGSIDQDREQVFGLWTNGSEMSFRMRTYHARTGDPVFEDLTDFPAPDETLDDLEDADRRPLRIASGDSLLRTFKRCHDHIHTNEGMGEDRAFWQLLYLIFAKILDEKASRRQFFVGATERNTDKGQKAIAARVKGLFDKVREAYSDVFDGDERIALSDRGLSFVAAELSRYSLLSTDTDAKGTAYEAITSHTLKQKRGQFFTPRNVIRMMVDMVAPDPGKRVLDPACGSGGFLVVALARMREHLLGSFTRYPTQPLPRELKKVEPELKRYAEKCLYGIDFDSELRKAARMNMLMNNDGRANILSFNSFHFGIPRFQSPDMLELTRRTGGHGSFDYVFTNPPFGAKLSVEDPEVLRAFDLGRRWTKTGDGAWVDTGALEKKVPPEILFIEACWKFLKPGTGVMAIVLPNGILGNPGEQMEFVRWWMLRNMELLASVDLPPETFLPQVSVQASCVFLRRRDENELKFLGKKAPKQRPVFMAIAEQCGHGRRGEPTWMRNPDGTELLAVEDVVDRWELPNGKPDERKRRRQLRKLADDMPWIANEYRRMLAEGSLAG